MALLPNRRSGWGGTYSHHRAKYRGCQPAYSCTQPDAWHTGIASHKAVLDDRIPSFKDLLGGQSTELSHFVGRHGLVKKWVAHPLKAVPLPRVVAGHDAPIRLIQIPLIPIISLTDPPPVFIQITIEMGARKGPPTLSYLGNVDGPNVMPTK